MSKPRLVAIYGLPGSGKTTLLARYAKRGWPIFDDFMKDAFYDEQRIPYSRQFVPIVNYLSGGFNAAISEIQLVREQTREELKHILCDLVPGLVIEWHGFDCSTLSATSRCRDNVMYRHQTQGRGYASALRVLGEWAHRFSFEPGSKVHRVINADKTRRR
jgi:GTPase SAR1 family protein